MKGNGNPALGASFHCGVLRGLVYYNISSISRFNTHSSTTNVQNCAVLLSHIRNKYHKCCLFVIKLCSYLFHKTFVKNILDKKSLGLPQWRGAFLNHITAPVHVSTPPGGKSGG